VANPINKLNNTSIFTARVAYYKITGNMLSYRICLCHVCELGRLVLFLIFK